VGLALSAALFAVLRLFERAPTDPVPEAQVSDEAIEPVNEPVATNPPDATKKQETAKHDEVKKQPEPTGKLPEPTRKATSSPEKMPRPPVRPPAWVPDGFAGTGDVVPGGDGRRFHRKLVRRLADDVEAIFVLIPPEPGPADGPFYLMEHKVSNGVYRLFAESKPDAVATSQWARGGKAGGRDVGTADPHLPTLRVTRPEAEAAARWLGGRLPTARELDRAAGLLHKDGRTGPAQGQAVAVRRFAMGPRRVDTPEDDVSPLGIADLAGNGTEWTSDNVRAGEQQVGVLRGRSYLAPAPLLFADLEQQRDVPLTQLPDRPSPYTGFRVALSIPDR
jgi:hypothetical protein